MFTGIVEGVGRVVRAEARGGSLRLAVDLGPLVDGVRIGDSIAVAGCCLTVVSIEGRVAAFDAIPETLSRTWLGALSEGGGATPLREVNLERAMRLGARLDGHIVQGHIDGTARIIERLEAGGEVRWAFEAEERLVGELVEKGSVALDGVSLTLTEVDPGRRRFGVALIPHTMAVTTFGALAVGDRVNLETDVMGKWVRRLAAPYIEAALRGAAGGAVAPAPGFPPALGSGDGGGPSGPSRGWNATVAGSGW